MMSTPNGSYSKSNSPKTGKIVVSGTLEFTVVDEDEVYNSDRWSVWSEESTIPKMRRNSNEENELPVGTVDVGEEETRMEEVDQGVEDVEEELNEISMKDIILSGDENATITIEDDMEDGKVCIRK